MGASVVPCAGVPIETGEGTPGKAALSSLGITDVVGAWVAVLAEHGIPGALPGCTAIYLRAGVLVVAGSRNGNVDASAARSAEIFGADFIIVAEGWKEVAGFFSIDKENPALEDDPKRNRLSVGCFCSFQVERVSGSTRCLQWGSMNGPQGGCALDSDPFGEGSGGGSSMQDGDGEW